MTNERIRKAAVALSVLLLFLGLVFLSVEILTGYFTDKLELSADDIFAGGIMFFLILILAAQVGQVGDETYR